MVKRINKRDIIIFSIAIIYIIINFIVSYIKISNYILVLLIALGIGATCFLNTSNLKIKQKVMSLFVALALEIGIIFISAFLFESNILFSSQETLFNAAHKLVSLYCIVGVFVIQDIIMYALKFKYEKL